jgi:hypothetical protein
MNAHKLLWAVFPFAVALPFQAHAGEQIEPNAGSWKTWVISSGRDYRVPPPPRPADTQAELRTLAALIDLNDAKVEQQIKYWGRRCACLPLDGLDKILACSLERQRRFYPHRVYTYVALAMHDATIATWESKYFYNRPRPSERDHKLPISLSVPKQSLLSIGTCCKPPRLRQPYLPIFCLRKRAVLPNHGGRGRLVPRLGRSAISQ